jgi:hypothetical protein
MFRFALDVAGRSTRKIPGGTTPKKERGFYAVPGGV